MNSNQGAFVYIDLIRLVSPYMPLPEKEYDFSLFGPFDAMRVITENRNGENEPGKPIRTISDLQKLHKDRYDQIPPMFDRQPLYLYSSEPIHNNIFSITEEPDAENNMAVRPLVMTLFQLRDSELNCMPETGPGSAANEAANLIGVFTEHINNLIKQRTEENIQFQVFYCLGESDIVVVFRSKELATIGNILYEMRIWKYEERNGKEIRDNDDKSGVNGEKNIYLQVLSNSSYCAFPKSKYNLEQNMQTWLNADKTTEFYTLTNTSFGLNKNRNPKCSQYLLGEWDFYWRWEKKTDAKYYADAVKAFTEEDVYQKSQPFRTTYTIPAVSLERSAEQFDDPGQKVGDIYHATYINFDNTSYKELIKALNAIENKGIFTKAVNNKYIENLDQMVGTLRGLHNHLVRLYYGRFEEDLFAFVNPVFETLKIITKNCTELLNRYIGFLANPKNQYKDLGYNNIQQLLDGYLKDLSDLLSELQHMFSILSVSPYTYLETYGSNMRSIAAACKLLIAYQGIAYKLGKEFGKGFVNETFIVLPYRNILSNTKEYFTNTSPKNNICRIYIDFTKMFHMRYTLFILLHECGHQLIRKDFRQERVKYYAASVMAALEDKCMNTFYADIRRTVGLGRNWNNDTEYDFDDKRLKDCETKIKNKFKAFYSVYSDKAYHYWFASYQKGMKDFCEPDALDACMFHYVRDAIWELLNAGGKDGQLDTLISLLIEEIYSNYRTLIVKELGSKSTRCSRWELNALYVDYSDKVQMEIKKKVAAEDLTEKMRRYSYNVCCELKNVFGEVYSDVFAYSVLQIENRTKEEKEQLFKEYIDTLITNCGYDVFETMISNCMILRLLAMDDLLFKAYKDGKSEKGRLVKILEKYMTDVQIEEFNTRTEISKNSLVYETIIKYRNFCVDTLKEQMKRSELKQLVKKICELYTAAETGEVDNMVGAIHYFWKLSTQRENQDDEGKEQIQRI